MNNLRRIDTNLLVTLHALLLEKHISRAAIRLHKSQPAVSHALAHLRTIFDDPLLIRRGKHLELSVKASGLLSPLTEALEGLEGLLEAPVFVPAESKRTFRLSMSDYGAWLILPELVRRLRTEAPDISLVVTQASREMMIAQANEGEVDIALGVFPGLNGETLRQQPLFEERFISVADASTLPADRMLSLAEWLARPHVIVTHPSNNGLEIESDLAALGLERKRQITLPHWRVANDLIPGSDLILTVASRNVTPLNPALCIFEPPLVIKPFWFQQLWHLRRDIDPAHQWLRQQIVDIAHASKTFF
ncbi:LysR family transcriptional regulator [uncultured Cedecea sp.]|uniref:LysR family transcriptional regulator n=1 Tax=uncultured Cedecea sp. TaxID=988762 RepID=UPI002605234F|nr:LysR family transcriptional regulator [uncultured Cedecea sp.]